jgi:hypothetical protein
VLLITACGVGAPANGQVSSDRQSPGVVVDGLRAGLVQEQKALVEAIAGGKTPASEEYVNRLRVELRSAVLATVQTSGEVDLAVTRAAIRDRLARIDAYESAFGLQDGARTTRLNVLETAELEGLETRLKASLRGLLAEAGRLPESAVPNSLRGRIFETRVELDAMEIERATRSGGAAPKLVSIGSEATAPDRAKALAQLQRIEVAEASQAAERALLIELEERLAWNPTDASLKEVRRQVRGSRPKALAVLRNARTAWPPGRGPPPPSGSGPASPPNPPPGPNPGFGTGPGPAPTSPNPVNPQPRGPAPVATAVDDLRVAATAEINALTQRNWRSAAEASARLAVAADWVGEAVGFPAQRSSPWEISAASMSQSDLEDSKAKLEDWKRALMRERAAAAPGTWHGDLEIRETDIRLRVLSTEIMIRGPPPPEPALGPHGPDAMRTAVALSAERAPVVNYNTYSIVAIERRKLVELEKQLPTAPLAERQAIQTAINDQRARWLEVESRAVSHAYDEAVRAEHQAYIAGRGPEGARAARVHRDAQDILRRQADALRGLTRSYVEQGIVEAGRAGAVTLTPPPGTGATIADYNPNTLTRVSRLAEGRATAVPEASLALSGRSVATAGAPEQLRFDSRFSRSGPNSAEAFRANPYRAPGGVIVDVKLPREQAERVTGVIFDPAARRFRVHLGESWQQVEPTVAPETVRAALAFILDGRVSAVDIGPFDYDVQLWLAGRQYLPSPLLMTLGEQEALLKSPVLLRIVRINPALASTAIGPALIKADELIFLALSLDPTVLAANSVFRGIDTLDLHERLKRERRALARPDEGYKSILTIESMTAATDGGRLVLRPAFDYAVYALPNKLNSTSSWFAEKHAALRAVSPELRQLEEFAVATALIRAAIDSGRVADLSNLGFIVEPGAPTPTLLCRSRIASECAAPLIQHLVAVDNAEEAAQ